MNRNARVPFVLLLVLTASFVWFGDALRKGEEALIQRRYAEAAEHLRKALKEETEGARDRVLLLLGRALALAGEHQQAVETYRRLVREFRDSPLRAKARFQEADALAADRRFADAAAIYAAEIQRLTGPQRKEQVAQTYLGLAEKALGKEPRDYARAVTFFDLALDLGLSPAKARRVRLLAAEAALKQGDAADAIRRFAPLVEELEIGQGKLRAMLGLGRARLAAKDAAGARSTFRDLIALAPDSEQAADAAYEVARSHGVPAPEAAELDRAVAALSTLAKRYPQHPKAKLSKLLAAQCFAHVGRSEDALRVLREFLAEQADSGLAEVAAARAMVGDVLAAQGKLEEAIAAWREYLAAHPAHKDWERVQRAIVDAEYRLAELAYDAGKEHFDRARRLFEAFTKAHPLDARNPQVLFLLGEMLFVEGRYDEARAAFERCVSKYPGKPASSHAQFRIGEIYETRTFNYLEALRAYEKVTWGPWAARARQRIARLRRKHLELLSPRTFRTGEKAYFRLTSRNIEKVRVRVYRLDLETWFRAMHTAGQVEKLDIEIIEPDKLFESAVENYRRYEETRRRVPIGFSDPGAYVVKVDDRELEATTMVLVTDLGLITKASRHELLVFTQNLREERPEGGVNVVVSDGKKVIAEGRTGEDGVWRYAGKELADVDELQVFAVDSSGSGAGSLRLAGLGYSQGLTPKAYLFTDRPVFQPGDTVHVKGIVREARDGLYRMPAPRGYTVTISSASGKVVLERPVRFTDFGTFAVDLVLPPEAELGRWRVQLRREGGKTFSTRFAVARYEVPKLSLTIHPERRVVYRGEKLEGKVCLRYFFGEPAAGKRIRYALRIPGGSRIERTGETNARGEVAFSFETREFAEEAVAVLEAAVAEENVFAQTAVPVVTTEFTPEVSTLRDVFLAGEPFDVRVRILDRSGKPIAVPGEARLLRYERVGKRRVEAEVAAVPFRTRAADGAATVSLTASKGGAYVVRVEARDRFGTLVTAQKSLEISGEDDEVRLRLLSDRQSWRVGETLEVKVVNRTKATLALRTFQGDGILSYDTVRLPAGESTMRVRLRGLHAPNFALALAMIDGTKLHTVQRDFEVARDLRISVRPSHTEVAPGEKVKLDVETADAEGDPVEAEVAISMVDRALLAIHPDRTPAIGAFFWGKRRETLFRTASSCSWRHRAPARRVSHALVAEELRLEREKEEAAREPEGEAGEFFLGRRGERRVSRRAAGGRAPRPSGPATPGSGGPRTPGPAQTKAQKWNTAVGIVGGAGGRFSGRGGRRSQQGAVLQPERWQAAAVDDLAFDRAAARMLAKNLDANRASDAARVDFSAFGAWFSSVRTDASGKASVEIPVPPSATEFSIKVRGVTRATDVGEAEAGIRAAKPLQAAIVAPFALTEGDVASGRLRVHNLRDERTPVEIEFEGRSGSRGFRGARRLDVAGHGEAETDVVLRAEGTEPIRLDLRARGAGLEDRARRVVTVRPYGIEHRAGASGRTTDAVRLSLSLPEGREFTGIDMVVEIGPDPGHDLVAAALGEGYRPSNCIRVASTTAALASRGRAALTVLGWLERSGRADPADSARLEALARSVLARLISAQGRSGGFAWIGTEHEDLTTTARAVAFLAMAQARGFEEAAAPLRKAVDRLLAAVRAARGVERVRGAHALALAGRAGFGLLNSLHRGRSGLDLEGSARLALAWRAAGRPELAAEALATLRPKLKLERTDPAWVEAVALAARALVLADPVDPDGRRALRWLEGRRRGASWGSPHATAAALAAIVAAGGKDAAAASKAEVTVLVNGRELGTVPPTVKTRNTRFSVPAAWLRERGNEVAIRVRGRGAVHYSAVLTGFARGFRAEDRRRDVVDIRRRYLPAYRRLGGKVVRPGFSVVEGRYQAFEDDMKRLEAGTHGRAEVRFRVREPYRATLTPLVLEEFLPAGCTVPRESIQGNHDHVIVEPGRLTFFFRRGVHSGAVRYELHGRFPGRFRVLPTCVYGAERPDVLAYGDPGELEVVPAGAVEESYRMTPDELYHIGKALFDRGDLDRAGKLLGELLREWHRREWKLRAPVYRDVARMMLFAAIARNDSKAVVRFFEDLKDLYEDLVIPFDKIVAVGKAYLDLGEFERALTVFRGTAEASFLKDAAVATTLEKLGEVKASIRFLRDLLREYPDLNTIRVSFYSIGQKLAAIAARLPEDAPVDERVGTREQLRHAALAVLREFLVLYPEDPLAEEVSFAWATTHVEAGELEGALGVARAALERYPNSSFQDELLYTVGYVQFALGNHEEAMKTLRRVAEEEFPEPDGGKGPSENRYHAIYLQGQIWHALGKPARALEMYEKVRDRFSDAAEASDFFLRKQLSLPEVTTFRLEKKVVLPLSYRNLREVDVKVYRVDLMRLYLLEKSLNDIRNVTLHGIRAYKNLRVPLGEGRYGTSTKDLELDLEEPGAYLVVARGDDLLATGMVLRSNLSIAPQESFDIGRIRVNVKDGDRFLPHARVVVVGSGDRRLRGGETDLRGVFVADGLVGKATVLVKKGDAYAFYRGVGIHQPERYAPAPARRHTPPRGKGGEKPSRKALPFGGWENNLRFNSRNRDRRLQWLQQEVLNKQQRGVEVYRAK